MEVYARLVPVVPLGSELVHVVRGQCGIIKPAQGVFLSLEISLEAGDAAGCCVAVASGVVLGES